MSPARQLTHSDVNGKQILMATIVAKRESIDLESTLLLIDVPALAPLPEFSKSLYHGSINEQKEFSMEDILLIEQTYSPDVTFELPAADGIYFKNHIN